MALFSKRNTMLKKNHSVALYMEGHLDSDYGKMGMGVIRYLPNKIVGVIDSTHQGKQINTFVNTPRNIPILATLDHVISAGAEVLILGIAPSGGKIPASWIPVIKAALKAGLSIVNGLHDLLAPSYGALIGSPNNNQWIWDVRVPRFAPPIATARAASLTNKRVLFIGTDMAVGKMTAGLELFSWFKERQENIGFVATGQIGITIMGSGIPLDAFKVDHACGAVETAVLDQADKDIILIEGQGSLLHPGSTATLPLMRGSCPTHLVLCHRAGKDTLRSPEEIQIPDLNAFIALNESLASICGTYPQAKVIGITLNTSLLDDQKAANCIAEIEALTGIPTTDVIRFGVDKIGKALLA